MIVISNNFGMINCIKLTRHAILKLKILKCLKKHRIFTKFPTHPGEGGHTHFFTEK